METLNETETKALEQFYDNLKNEVKKKDKLERNSVFISFIRGYDSTKYDLLKNSSVGEDYVSSYALETLLEKELITETDMPNKYAITAKGVWKVEKGENIIDDQKIIQHFEEEFFNQYSYSDKELGHRQKTLLLAMISARAFSEDACVDLKDEKALDKWVEIIEKSYSLLQNQNIIGEEGLEDLYYKGNMHKVAGLFRRCNLQNATKKIFKPEGKKEKYYLDVSEDGQLDENKLEFLFEKIVEGRELDLEKLEEINQFCTEISENESIYLFDSEDREFIDKKYDETLWNVIMSL